jgi:hypothetical protein
VASLGEQSGNADVGVGHLAELTADRDSPRWQWSAYDPIARSEGLAEVPLMRLRTI